jgi:biotin transport system permease protein/energy-coupling factor transport system permease protein
LKRRHDTSSAFSYKPGNSFVHRCPAGLKILLVPVVSIAVFKLPLLFCIFMVMAQLALSIRLHFSPREQVNDFRAVVYYAFFLIFARLVSALAGGTFAASLHSQGIAAALKTLLLEKESLTLLLKLFCVMQSAAILFRTSTTLQIRESLEKLEGTLRRPFAARTRHKSPLRAKSCPHHSGAAPAPVAQTISLFLCFIPQVSKIWQQAVRAWKARGGRLGLKMYMTLLPVLFSVGMKQAYNQARAITIRSAR